MTLREEIGQGENVALEYMKEVEGWGGGVSRYFESCERMGIPLPIVEEAAGCVKVVFRRRIAANGGNGGNGGNPDGDGANAQAHILSVLRENPRLTAHAVSEKTGMAPCGRLNGHWLT